jgi:hypothetical protein
MKISKFMLLFFLVPAAAFADLGQNELKTAETYGVAISERKISDALVERRYFLNGVSITVTFLNGTSQCEVFRKADGSPMSDDQINRILEANGNRLTWTEKTSTAQKTREWVVAGPKPSAPEESSDPAVMAVSGRRPSAISGAAGRGGLIAVDMLESDKSASPPSAPPVLRKAVYQEESTNSVMKVFTSAYENVAKRQARQDNSGSKE